MRIIKQRSKGVSADTFYYLIKAPEKGPVCLVTAGIHGTEIAGVAAARLIKQIRIQRGTLIVVPLVNKIAYQRRSRGYPGCPDLNRTFPYHLGDPPRHPLAAELIRLVRRYRPQLCLDLHEANGYHLTNPSQLGQSLILYPNPASFRLARRVIRSINPTIESRQKRFVILQRVLPGSFRTSAARLFGCRAITVETSIHQSYRVRVHYQTMIVRRFLREFGMLD